MQREFFDRPGIRFLDGGQDNGTKSTLLRVRVPLDSLAVASEGLAFVNKSDCVGPSPYPTPVTAPAWRLPSCEKKLGSIWVQMLTNSVQNRVP